MWLLLLLLLSVTAFFFAVVIVVGGGAPAAPASAAAAAFEFIVVAICVAIFVFFPCHWFLSVSLRAPAKQSSSTAVFEMEMNHHALLTVVERGHPFHFDFPV